MPVTKTPSPQRGEGRGEGPSLKPLLLAGMLGALVACGPQEMTSICGATRGKVARVVDGDTIELEAGERIRYLLVDAPETTGGKNDCYGSNAVDFNKAQVEGKEISIKYDEAECKDRYDRLLAYVSVGGKEVNKGLVENGLACVLYIPPAGRDRHVEFEDAASVAKTNRTGLWGACNPVTCE
jgi:micrococcal nuclease